jgi:hypothetical protein
MTVSGRRDNPLKDTLILLQLHVILTVDIGKAPLARNNDLLATRELITGATESFLNGDSIGVLAANGENDLANVDTRNGAVGFAPRATHTGLQPAANKRYAQTHSLVVMDQRAYQRQHTITSC